MTEIRLMKSHCIGQPITNENNCPQIPPFIFKYDTRKLKEGALFFPPSTERPMTVFKIWQLRVEIDCKYQAAHDLDKNIKLTHCTRYTLLKLQRVNSNWVNPQPKLHQLNQISLRTSVFEQDLTTLKKKVIWEFPKSIF